MAEKRGNPLALHELPPCRKPAEHPGRFGLSGGPAVPGRIEQSFRERRARLREPTRLLLLVAAAEPAGVPVLVWRAAARLGIGPDAAAPAAAAGLVVLGAQVRFSHPLVRSAVYRAGTPEERQRVHRALAEATDADADPDRRAWHRAQAAAGPDEDVAAELERSAGRARARGGLAAGAAFHERAAELTPDLRRRAQRALLAAQGKHQAGAPDAALRLLAMAQAGPLDEHERARAQLLHAQITFAMTRGRDAPPLLLEAARRLEPLDPRLARETYLEAFAAALSADRLVRGGDASEVAAAVLAAGWEPATRACDLLLDGLARLTREGYVAAAPALKVALRAFRDEPLSEEDELRWLWLACRIARALADDEAWDQLTARHLDVARRAGAFAALPVALTDRVLVELFSGRTGVAMSLAAESDAVVEATGSHLTLRTSIVLANWRGRDAAALALIEARREEVLRRGEGLWLAANDWGSAIRYNGLGRYEEALAAAEQATKAARGLGPSIWLLAELIEAAARSGQAERATGPLAQLAEITSRRRRTDWALRDPRARCGDAGGRGHGRAALPGGDRTALSRIKTRATLASRAPPVRPNGCGASTGAPTLARSCEPLTRCSRTWAWRRLPSAPAASCWPPARSVREAHGREARRADPAGGAGRAPGRRTGRSNPQIKGPAVPQSAHGGVAPEQGVRESSGSAPARELPRSAVRRLPRLRIGAGPPAPTGSLASRNLRQREGREPGLAEGRGTARCPRQGCTPIISARRSPA